MGIWKSIRELLHSDVSLEELVNPYQAMARAKRSVLLIRETIRSILRHQSLTVASALAFKTLTALVPVLMISIIIVGSLPPPSGSGDESMKDFFISVIASKIPNAPQLAPPLIGLINTIAEHATGIKIVGFLLLFFTVYSLLYSIETSFNMIWQVKSSRPFFNRAVAYLATVILVPVLLTLSVLITSNFTKRASAWLDQLQTSTTEVVKDLETHGARTLGFNVEEASPPPPANTPAEKATAESTNATPAEAAAASTAKGTGSEADDSTPKTANPQGDGSLTAHAGRESAGFLSNAILFLGSLFTTVLALGALYFLMPYTRVKWQSAVAGGIFAGVLIESIKIGFRYYAAHAATNLTAIYGGTLLAVPLGLLWLWLIWSIILIGAEIAFTIQNFADLATRAELEKRGLTSRVYFGVRIVVLASEYFHRGQSPDELVDRLAETLRLPPYAIREIIQILIEKEILRQVTKGEDAYLPAKDISVLSVGEVVRAINDDPLMVPELPDDKLRDYLNAVFSEVDSESRQRLDRIHFSDLITIQKQSDTVSATPELCEG